MSNYRITNDKRLTVADMDGVQLFAIGDMARACNVSPEAIRAAEKNGRIPRALRVSNGSRVYTIDQVELCRRVLGASRRGRAPVAV
jgi:hypothetical protein